ncbi:hypothetical protein C8R45DRAFT_612567 [Mycena sanguinolenta]|nr:hypothetical protein C8R45DRAFT_612567 [Mycena sanguinolenta]
MEGDADQVFVENGLPIKFHLHKSIRQPGARLALEHTIQLHGGEINATDVGSNVIIVNPEHPSGDRDKLRHAYKTHTQFELNPVYVESTGWVDNCVKIGRCIHYFVQKGMGGRIAGGGGRTAFTEEDDQRLARYIAILIPDKTTGGRTGNNVFKRLMNNFEMDPEEYSWAGRHTWQSWRERYRKRQDWFDDRIAALAAHIKPALHQQYELSRKANHRLREEEEESGSDEEQEEEEDELEDEEAVSGTKRPISGSRTRQVAKKMRIDSTPPPDPDATQVARTANSEDGALSEDDE